MGRLTKYLAEMIARSKTVSVFVAICVMVGIAFLGDRVFHTRYAHLSLVLPFLFSAYLFMSAKIIDYRLVNGHIKIVGLGLFTLFDLPVADIASVESFSPFSVNLQRKKLLVYRMGNSFGEGKTITMRDGRVFTITPQPGTPVYSILSLHL